MSTGGTPVLIETGAPGFTRRLIEANRLDLIGFSEFLFFPGMLFGRDEKWWGRGGFRTQSHEGLDLCFFSDKSGGLFRLDESVGIPCAFDGQIVHILDDFLGKSVVVGHRDAVSGRCSYLFYAHIRPDRTLAKGDRLSAGEIFAHIAPTAPDSPLPPHLHLTMALADNLPPVDTLSWPVLNKMDRGLLLDPMSVLGARHRIIEFNPELDLHTLFIPIKSEHANGKPISE